MKKGVKKKKYLLFGICVVVIILIVFSIYMTVKIKNEQVVLSPDMEDVYEGDHNEDFQEIYGETGSCMELGSDIYFDKGCCEYMSLYWIEEEQNCLNEGEMLEEEIHEYRGNYCNGHADCSRCESCVEDFNTGIKKCTPSDLNEGIACDNENDGLLDDVCNSEGECVGCGELAQGKDKKCNVCTVDPEGNPEWMTLEEYYGSETQEISCNFNFNMMEFEGYCNNGECQTRNEFISGCQGIPDDTRCAFGNTGGNNYVFGECRGEGCVAGCENEGETINLWVPYTCKFDAQGGSFLYTEIMTAVCVNRGGELIYELVEGSERQGTTLQFCDPEYDPNSLEDPLNLGSDCSQSAEFSLVCGGDPEQGLDIYRTYNGCFGLWCTYRRSSDEPFGGWAECGHTVYSRQIPDTDCEHTCVEEFATGLQQGSGWLEYEIIIQPICVECVNDEDCREIGNGCFGCTSEYMCYSNTGENNGQQCEENNIEGVCSYGLCIPTNEECLPANNRNGESCTTRDTEGNSHGFGVCNQGYCMGCRDRANNEHEDCNRCEYDSEMGDTNWVPYREGEVCLVASLDQGTCTNGECIK